MCAHTHMFMCSCVEDRGQLLGVLSIHHMNWQAWGQLPLVIESCLWPLLLSVYSITCWIQAKNISWKLSPRKGETCCFLVICSMMKKPSGWAELFLLLEHWSCIYTLHQSLSFIFCFLPVVRPRSCFLMGEISISFQYQIYQDNMWTSVIGLRRVASVFTLLKGLASPPRVDPQRTLQRTWRKEGLHDGI